MKKLCIVLSLSLAALACAQAPTAAVPAAPNGPDARETLDALEMQRNAERERLTRARQQLEDNYQQDMRQCYQNFDVTTCRLKARDRRIEANAVLRKDELKFNASERLIHAEDAKRALAERNSEAEKKKAETARAAAITGTKERADANAQKQIDHALQGTKRGDYEQKQRDAAQHREDVAKKLRERTKEPAAPLPVPGQ